MTDKVLEGCSYKPAWLTWVAATTTALNGMGIEADCAEVAALSGYAFILNISAKEVCVSGPTCFTWSSLLHGLRAFGVEPTVFAPAICGYRVPAAREYALRQLFERVRAEIDAGRPAVIWGTHVPEFGVAIGYTKDEYVVCSFKSHEEPRVRWDALEIPGGVYGLFLRPAPAIYRRFAEIEALHHAVDRVRGTDATLGQTYVLGLAAYEAWAACLERGAADEFGHAYNLACWHEGRMFAADWLNGLALHHPSAKEPLRKAADAYGAAAAALGAATRLTPFPPKGVLADPTNREKVARLLRTAAEVEECALEAMDAALTDLAK